MDTVKIQIILFWAAVTVYVAATCLMLAGLVFKRTGLLRFIPALAVLGFIPQTAGIVLRWMQTGHFPYWGKYEIFNSYAWGAIALYLLIMLIKPELKITGVVFFPAAFFMTGIALTHSAEIKEIPGSYFTYWLGVHIAFAKLAYGAALVAAFFGGLYLLKSRAAEKGQKSVILNWGPPLEEIDGYVYKFAVFAFITLNIMIGAGAVWGFKAWGRYWGWDPIESWSLVTWLVYGILLHLRVTMGWRGRKIAWLSIVALVVIVFSYFGMPLIYDSVHEHMNV